MPAATSANPTSTAAPTTASPSTKKDCFADPGACGYPDPAAGNVGANCGSLTAFNPSDPPAGTSYNGSGLLEVTSPDTTISDIDFPSNMAIQFASGASGSTLDHVCLLTNGADATGSTAVQIAAGATGIHIENSTLGGANTSTEASDQAITNTNNDAGTTADNDELINCGDCVMGTWTLDDSYVDADASLSGEHYEDWYFSDGTISANDDVFLNPQEQTADIFGDTNGGDGGPADNHVTLTNSLLAGGGYMLYADGNSSSAGSSTADISGNRFARCDTSQDYNGASGGTACSGGADKYGFWPKGGYFGIDSKTYCGDSGQTWTDNVWDDNNASVSCS